MTNSSELYDPYEILLNLRNSDCQDNFECFTNEGECCTLGDFYTTTNNRNRTFNNDTTVLLGCLNEFDTELFLEGQTFDNNDIRVNLYCMSNEIINFDASKLNMFYYIYGGILAVVLLCTLSWCLCCKKKYDKSKE